MNKIANLWINTIKGPCRKKKNILNKEIIEMKYAWLSGIAIIKVIGYIPLSTNHINLTNRI